MDKFIPIIYLLGVFVLVLPSFLSSNNKLKNFLTNFSIWFVLLLILLTVYYLYNLFLS